MLIGTRPKSCTRWTKLSKTLYGALACNRTYQDYCRVVMILISDSLQFQYLHMGISKGCNQNIHNSFQSYPFSKLYVNPKVHPR